MLNKIKGIIEVQEHIAQMQKDVKKQQQSIQQHTTVLESLGETSTVASKETKLLARSVERMNKRLETELEEFSKVKAKLKEELSEVKILKSNLRKTIMEQVSQEVHEELTSQLDRIRTDVRSYNETKIQLQHITKEIDNVKGALQKFLKISKHIQETDFELTKYAKKLTANDKEKVELLKKIDNLQRLLAKERRSRNSF